MLLGWSIRGRVDVSCYWIIRGERFGEDLLVLQFLNHLTLLPRLRNFCRQVFKTCRQKFCGEKCIQCLLRSGGALLLGHDGGVREGRPTHPLHDGSHFVVDGRRYVAKSHPLRLRGHKCRLRVCTASLRPLHSDVSPNQLSLLSQTCLCFMVYSFFMLRAST